MQAGFGAGVGSAGLAGSYFVFGDVWPLPFAGAGLEWNRAGSTLLRIFEENAHDSHDAIRGRLSLRLRVGRRGTLSASASIGRGTFAQTTMEPCRKDEETGCLDDLDGYRVGAVTSGTRLSFGGQLGAHGRHRQAAFGLVARVDVVGPAVAITFGPTLGFEM